MRRSKSRGIRPNIKGAAAKYRTLCAKLGGAPRLLASARSASLPGSLELLAKGFFALRPNSRSYSARAAGLLSTACASFISRKHSFAISGKPTFATPGSAAVSGWYFLAGASKRGFDNFLIGVRRNPQCGVVVFHHRTLQATAPRTAWNSTARWFTAI